MVGNFKNIHLGQLIKQRVEECKLDLERASNFLGLSEKEIVKVYTSQSIDTDILLKWSKLLKYDFFRIYSQHLILYSPQHVPEEKEAHPKSSLPVFKKNIYTQEVIDYIVELVTTQKMTAAQIHKKYNIPFTTIGRWVNKYNTK